MSVPYPISIGNGGLILQPVMVQQLGKQGKRRADLFFFTVHWLRSNSLPSLLIDFIKSLILLSTQLKAEKPLMHHPKGKPSAETEKANSTVQLDILRVKTMFSLPGELL